MANTLKGQTNILELFPLHEYEKRLTFRGYIFLRLKCNAQKKVLTFKKNMSTAKEHSELLLLNP